MPVTHVNRRGDTYYLIRGQTKTGKAKYHFSKKAGEQAVEAIPSGYEIYEKPDTAQVGEARDLAQANCIMSHFCGSPWSMSRSGYSLPSAGASEEASTPGLL